MTVEQAIEESRSFAIEKGDLAEPARRDKEILGLIEDMGTQVRAERLDGHKFDLSLKTAFQKN